MLNSDLLWMNKINLQISNKLLFTSYIPNFNESYQTTTFSSSLKLFSFFFKSVNDKSVRKPIVKPKIRIQSVKMNRLLGNDKNKIQQLNWSKNIWRNGAKVAILLDNTNNHFIISTHHRLFKAVDRKISKTKFQQHFTDDPILGEVVIEDTIVRVH